MFCPFADAVGWAAEGHLACKKTEWWGAGMVICLQRGADLHMAQLMPLPFIVCCFSKIQIGFTFLVPAHPGSSGRRVVMCVTAETHKQLGADSVLCVRDQCVIGQWSVPPVAETGHRPSNARLTTPPRRQAVYTCALFYHSSAVTAQMHTTHMDCVICCQYSHVETKTSHYKLTKKRRLTCQTRRNGAIKPVVSTY